MSPVEAVAAALILVNVWLVARRSIWNYAFGLAGVALTGWVVLDAKLYSDALLQAFFFVLQFYGWWQWSRSQAENGEVVVETLTPVARLVWSGAVVAATLGWGWLMYRFTDASQPFLDALVAMTSVAAQVLMSRRKVENWPLWILVNALSVGLYATKHLWAFAVLYVLLFALSIWGLAKWRAARQSRRMTRTICLHGPESTGKSTLAPLLAERLGGQVVDEYGREYAEARGIDFTMADLREIARIHDAGTQMMIATGADPLILDTDPLMTAVWADMLFGTRDPWFEAWKNTADLYLLFDTDLPWIEDGTRMFGTPDARQRFFNLSKAELERRGVRWALISGDGETRLDNALAAIREAGLA